MLEKAYKKFQRGQHAEIHLLALTAKDKARMELSQDIVSGSTSICRTICMHEVQSLVTQNK